MLVVSLLLMLHPTASPVEIGVGDLSSNRDEEAKLLESVCVSGSNILKSKRGEVLTGPKDFGTSL